MVHSLGKLRVEDEKETMEARRLGRLLTIGIGIVILIGFVVANITTVLEQVSYLVVSSTKPSNTTQNVTAPLNNSTIPSSSPPRRRLELVHIPKTGGTAVELSAAHSNVTWGFCHFRNKKDWCSPKRILPNDVPNAGCNLWHMPTPFFLYHPNLSPYSNADLFTIVRNPYSRALSEYYWQRKRYPEKLNDPKHLNQRIQTVIRPSLVMERPDYSNKKVNKEYHFNDCHWIPQYDYVYHKNGTRLIQHIVKFENFRQDFDRLLQEYQLPVQLQQEEVRTPFRNRNLTISDLSLETLQLIETVYAKDFQAFGYEILSKKNVPENV